MTVVHAFDAPGGSAADIPHSVVTSGTRPGSPADGDMIYETDTGKVLIWNGTNWLEHTDEDTSFKAVTSGTRPASPGEGALIYETDTDDLLVFDGAAWNPPRNLPWGVLGSVISTSNQSGISAVTDITGLSATFTAIVNRRYKLSLTTEVRSTVATDRIDTTITDGVNATQTTAFTVNPSTTRPTSVTIFVVVSPGAGSITYKGRIALGSGSGTITLDASATNPTSLLIEDIGPT